MAKAKRLSSSCSEVDKVEKTVSTSGCCTSLDEAAETKDASVCCGPQIKSPPADAKRAEQKRLNIDFMYLDLSVCERCQGTGSSLEEAIAEVARILEATGVKVTLRKIHVTSEEQARALGFRVSPTIRLNGWDIQMNFRESLCESCGTLCECEGGVSCREWEYQGQWHTVPPKGLIIEAILREVYRPDEETREEPPKAAEVPDNLRRFFAGLR